MNGAYGFDLVDFDFGHGKERKGKARRGGEKSSGKAYTVVNFCTSCTFLSLTLYLHDSQLAS